VRRLIPFIILAVLVVASAVTLVLSYHETNARTASVRIDLSCSNKTGIQPSSYVITCADANTLLTKLTWSDWGQATAYATGDARWNNCTPDCVSGHWKSEPVTVWAWRVRDGLYTRLASSDPKVLTQLTVAPYPA